MSVPEAAAQSAIPPKDTLVQPADRAPLTHLAALAVAARGTGAAASATAAKPNTLVQPAYPEAAYGTDDIAKPAAFNADGGNAQPRRTQQSAPLPATASDSEPATAAAPAIALSTSAAPRPQTFAFTDTRDRASDVSASAIAAPFAIAAHGDTMPQVTIAPRMDTPEWQPAFAHNVKMLVNDGVTGATLQLNPAEFGPIQVRIVMTEQRADISFMVTSTDANAALQSALPELRDQLARSGIQLGQTSVGAQSQNPHQPAPAPRPTVATAGTPGTSAPAGAPQPVRPRSSSQIDTFA
jgi:flagellar hook-length control protein FliK